MFDKPKRKRKKKKSGQRPSWQTLLPWALLLVAFGMLGYAYLLDSQPDRVTVQAIQNNGLAERTPEFSENTRDLSGRPDTPDTAGSLSGADDSTTTQTLSDRPDNSSDEALSQTTGLADASALCDIYRTLHRCQN